jgi:uncharacterized protein
MSFNVMANMTAKALRTGRMTHFIWHGGEPLLMGRDFFKKAMWLQERYRGPNQYVTNAVQTNGTLLDDDWIDLFEAGNFSIGVSLDGPPDIHDFNRVRRNGRGSFDSVMRGIELLKARNQSFGVLAVLTENAVRLGPQGFFDFFVENGITSFAILSLNPAIITGDTRHMSRSDHSEFVKDVFDVWLERNDPDVHIRDFESIMRVLLGGEHSVCLLAGNCIGRYFAVNFDGDFYHCDEFMTDKQYRLGNIVDDELQDLLEGPAIQALRRTEKTNLQNLECEWLPVCNGGCPKDRYVAARFGSGGQVVCCGYAGLIEHIRSRIVENPQLASTMLESNATGISGPQMARLTWPG